LTDDDENSANGKPAVKVADEEEYPELPERYPGKSAATSIPKDASTKIIFMICLDLMKNKKR
jgi:hypothetical protein